MDILNIILIISVLIILFFVAKHFLPSMQTNIKTPTRKKHEIIDEYKQQMHEVINTYKNDPSGLTAEKTKLLKQISKELATNIFFDKDEVRQLLQDLAKM